MSSVPLNVLLKAREVGFCLLDAQARALVTWAGVADEAIKGAGEAGVRAVYVVNTPGVPEFPAGRRFEELLAVEPETPLLEQTDPGDTAVIVYTSGTTGTPKGAELSHFQLYMNADTPGRLFGIRDDDVVMVVLPLFHVFGSVQPAERVRAVRGDDVARAAVRHRRRCSRSSSATA